mgnify:CR=1 FL=1
MNLRLTVLALNIILAGAAQALDVEIHQVTAEGVGAALGTIQLSDTPEGLKLSPTLKNLPGQVHGFHIHEKPSCAPGEKDGKPGAALSAGGHYDPDHTGKHEGPAGQGHKGDLPLLKVDAKGNANEAVVAPRLKLADVTGHSLMIHVKGDNYSDTPEKLGGGGARFACGVVGSAP